MARYYIASGWFTPEQEKARQDILEVLKEREYYSPKDQSCFNPELQNWDEVFRDNVENIDDSNVVISSTIGYDPGTMWEAGYAFARGKEIIYYAPGISKFNLMLAKSSTKVCTDKTSLEMAIQGYNFNYCKEIE